MHKRIVQIVFKIDLILRAYSFHTFHTFVYFSHFEAERELHVANKKKDFPSRCKYSLSAVYTIFYGVYEI